MKKNQFKKYFLIYLLSLLVLANANLALAATDYQNSGVQNGIKTYLCVPTDVSKNTNPKDTGVSAGTSISPTNPRTAAQSVQDQKEVQYSSGAGNKAQYDLYNCIKNIYKFAIAIGSVFAVFYIVLAGYMYMTSDGSSEAIDKGKSMLVSSITAMVILFSGYILLKAINPDLIAFKNIQPPSVKLQTVEVSDYQPLFDGNGNLIGVKNSSGQTITAPQSKNDPNQITSAGCTFQSQESAQDISKIQTDLFSKVVEICRAGSSKGKIQISSVARGEHAKDSYHYKFCAVDFADGTGNFLNNPAGVAAMDKAKQILDPKRVNPGTDENKVNHMHVDLGSACKQ